METEIIFDELNSFFRWYRQNYQSSIILDGILSDTSMQAAEPTSGIVPRDVKAVEIHQQSPELDAFYLEIKDCQKCPLGATRKNFVFGYGNPQTRVLFIGEAPGQDEDEQGIPFVGPAGRLLTHILKAIDLSREDIFIANVLKCRPPFNREPLPEEMLKCEPYLQKQIALIAPKVIVALGRTAAQALLKRTDNMSILRGINEFYESIPVLVTYHPAALLRSPHWKELCWEDMKKLRNLLKSF